MNTNILGIVGKRGSGKDTFYCCCAELYIDRRIGYMPYRVAFADKLKEEIAQRHNITVLELSKNKEKYRKELQEYGVAMREKDPEYWIKQVRAPKGWAKDGFVIFTDVRFENEASYIKSVGGKVIRLRRDKTDTLGDGHISEIELEKIVVDNILHNNDSILRFKFEVLDLLKQYGIN
jgi:phosphomevalonate kinase